MGNPLKKIGEWVAAALTEKALEPLQAISDKLDAQEKAITELSAKVEAKHADDDIAKECDISLMHERIYYMIGKCREKGYTTEGDRRVIDHLHEVYHQRGGNHGEGNEYAIYRKLPTEEEWRREHA